MTDREIFCLRTQKEGEECLHETQRTKAQRRDKAFPLFDTRTQGPARYCQRDNRSKKREKSQTRTEGHAEMSNSARNDATQQHEKKNRTEQLDNPRDRHSGLCGHPQNPPPSSTHNQKDNQNDNEQSSLSTLAFLLLLLLLFNNQHQSKEP